MSIPSRISPIVLAEVTANGNGTHHENGNGNGNGNHAKTRKRVATRRRKRPTVEIRPTETPGGTVLLNLNIGGFVGTQGDGDGAQFEVAPALAEAIQSAVEQHENPVSQRRKLDPDADLPFTEGHATRQAWAQGYPLREDGSLERLGVTITTHGNRYHDGDELIPTRITIEQSDWPQAEGEIEIYAKDIPILLATLKKALAIAEATGVLDPSFREWNDPEHAR
jgi:hypothetical protein